MIEDLEEEEEKEEVEEAEVVEEEEGVEMMTMKAKRPQGEIINLQMKSSAKF